MGNSLTSYSSEPRLWGGLAILFIVHNVFSSLRLASRIRKLGNCAPIRSSYAPFGLDLAYLMITSGLRDRSYEFWQTLFQRWSPGHWTVEAGVGQRVIMTAEPENIKAILATQFKEFGKGKSFHDDWFDFLGNGIFNVDGELWHDSRQLLRPQFIKDRLSDLDIFEHHIQDLIRKISEVEEIDVLDLFFRYTLDAATHFLLGRSIGSMHQVDVPFARAFYNVQYVQAMIAKLGPLNWAIPRKRLGFYKSLKVMDEFVDNFVDQALALPQEQVEEKSTHNEGYTFLHAIAAYTRDRKMLRDQLVSLLLAGRDTTACTLTWAIYELSCQPLVVAKLREEILNCIGLDRAPTFEDLKSMRYLSRVLNETLRLYPAVPVNMRFALQDTTLPTGGGLDGKQPIGIPKDTPITWSTLVLQRREDLYSPVESGFPAVDKFVPERWESWTPAPWTHVPFNGGPRICLGQQFALAEMGYTLVRLLQRFETIENRMDGEHPGLHADVILSPGKAVKVAFL